MSVLDTYRDRVKEIEKKINELSPQRHELAVQSLTLWLIQIMVMLTSLIIHNDALLIIGAIMAIPCFYWGHRFGKVIEEIHELTFESATIRLALNLAIHVSATEYLERLVASGAVMGEPVTPIDKTKEL